MNLEGRLSDILVKDVMTKAIVSVDSSTTVYQVAKIMEKGGFGAILVKKNGLPEGIITDRDFAIKITVGKHSFDTPAHKMASRPLQTVGTNESILDAARILATKKIRKLVVVEDGKVVGIITSTDIVNWIAKTKG